MVSNFVLMQASSGLAKLMTTGPQSGAIKDSTVAQVSAALYYQTHVMASLSTSPAFQKKFQDVIFKQIDKDFGDYLDSKARTNPSQFHHVYEWKGVGNPSARLFKLNAKNRSGLSFQIGYDFKLSRSAVPSNTSQTRHVFRNKAAIMEEGGPLVIRPKNSERLVFEVRGSMVFMPKGKSVTVPRAGGGKTTSKFKIAYAQFFRGNLVSSSIKRSGFQKIFNYKIAKAMGLPKNIKTIKYSFSPNTVGIQAKLAVESAFGA